MSLITCHFVSRFDKQLTESITKLEISRQTLGIKEVRYNVSFLQHLLLTQCVMMKVRVPDDFIFAE